MKKFIATVFVYWFISWLPGGSMTQHGPFDTLNQCQSFRSKVYLLGYQVDGCYSTTAS